jgi:hypothetical protein
MMSALVPASGTPGNASAIIESGIMALGW